MSSKGDNRVLRKFFTYSYTSIIPNIDVYQVDELEVQLISSTFCPFQPDDIEECMKSCKHENVYHAIAKLKNSNYIYLKGHVQFDSDHFDVFISKKLKNLLPYISSSLLSPRLTSPS